MSTVNDDAGVGRQVPTHDAQAGRDVLDQAFPPITPRDRPRRLAGGSGEAGHAVKPTDPLARASLVELAHYRAISEQAGAATRAMNEALSPKLWDAVEELLDLRMQQHEASTDLFVAELIRHFPGLAPALRRVWHHVGGGFFDEVGICCVPPEPDRP